MDEIIRLNMNDFVAKRLKADMICEEELLQVIRTAEESGNYLIDRDSSCRFAHRRIGHITYWVRYVPEPDGSFTVHDAYSHRMLIVDDIDDDGKECVVCHMRN